MKYALALAFVTAVAVADKLPFCPPVTKTETVYAPGPTDAVQFDCQFEVHATPDQVVNSAGTAPAPGQPGAFGTYKYGIDKSSNTIYYVS